MRIAVQKPPDKLAAFSLTLSEVLGRNALLDTPGRLC
jgi:hypothetical protein